MSKTEEFLNQMSASLLEEAKKRLPEEVLKDIEEISDIQARLTARIFENLALSVPDVQRYNSLCYKRFGSLQDGGEFEKVKATDVKGGEPCEAPSTKGHCMPRAMLSQPMAGQTDEQIAATRQRAIEALEERGYEVINTLFTDEWYSDKAMRERGVIQKPLCFLAKSLENMSRCDAAYFCAGWEKARGCRIEHESAKAYGLKIIYEEEPTIEKLHLSYAARTGVYADAIDHFGIKAQLHMAIEEMSELTKEICKDFRGADNREQIAEEVADVTITLEQLRLIFGINDEVKKYRDQKVSRLAEKLRNEVRRGD